MYKLFLTIRYLTRKAIVIFPILVVWLCVAMLIIVTSIMGGFANRVREVSRDVTGDVVIASNSRAGFPYYEEIQSEIAKLPDVELSTPMIQAFGLLNTHNGNANAQIYGIIPEERARVTRWGQSLFYQNTAPEQALEDLSRGGFPVTLAQLEQRASKMQTAVSALHLELAKRQADLDVGRPVTGRGFTVAFLFLLIPVALLEWLLVALTRDATRGWRKVWWIFPSASAAAVIIAAALPMIPHSPGPSDREYLNDAWSQYDIASARASRAVVFAHILPAGSSYKNAAELRTALFTPPSFSNVTLYDRLFSPATATAPATAPANTGVIVGADMAYKRNLRGNYERPPLGLNLDAVLTVAPMVPSKGLGGSTPILGLNAQNSPVRIIDDSYSGFFEYDKAAVYADFKLVQKLALMHAQEADPEDPRGTAHPARASAIEVKIKGDATPQRLAAARNQIAAVVDAVRERHFGDFIGLDITVQTWDEKQATYINAVENEKNMITFILLLMSKVVLVVIFLIFYIVVRDKTRDIGIIKAVGGSELGVAGIFTIYGAVIGIIGGLAGAVTGMTFVRHTNEIHEWIYQTFHVMIWRRDVYMFDRIPDRYNLSEVALYFSIAVGAGILGALIPALKAGFQNPIRALRYE